MRTIVEFTTQQRERQIRDMVASVARYFTAEISLRPEANEGDARTTNRFILLAVVSRNRFQCAVRTVASILEESS